MSASSLVFPTDYASILARIDEIDPLQYAKTRNFIDGAVTYLSPYISRGVISTKVIRDRVLARGFHPQTIEKFLQELAWREYFQRVWQAKGDLIFEDLKQPQADVAHHQMIAALLDAATGIESIDQSILNLYQTGYLHNHVRMYIASLACNIGKAHWGLPSQWMYAHLLDGDLASNTCSWQWVAGSFASKKYFANQENINRFTHSNQQGTFLDVSMEGFPLPKVPIELTDTRPWELVTNLPASNAFHLDVTKPTLVYNSYHLDPTWRKDDDANRVLLLEPSHFKKYPVSEQVIQFSLELAKNIPGIQVVTGEVSDLVARYGGYEIAEKMLMSREHPAFTHYPGKKDEREWMFPQVKGYYSSFFSFWKQCEKGARQE